MKRLLVLALICLVVFSCKKEEDDSNSSNSNINSEDCFIAANYQFTPNSNQDTSMYNNSTGSYIFYQNNYYSFDASSSGGVNYQAICDEDVLETKGWIIYENGNSVTNILFTCAINSLEYDYKAFEYDALANMEIGEYIIENNCYLPFYPPKIDVNPLYPNGFQPYFEFYDNNLSQRYYVLNSTLVRMNLKEIEITDLSTQINNQFHVFIRANVSYQGIGLETDTTQTINFEYDVQLDLITNK